MRVKQVIGKNWLLYVWGVLILFQLVIFWNAVVPAFGEYIITKGLVCTCPDAKVMEGKELLAANTPDSLMYSNLDYSEIFLHPRPATDFDYQGAREYIVYGKIIGKKRVSESEPWHPLFKVTSFKENDIQFNRILRMVILSQIFILGLITILKALKE